MTTETVDLNEIDTLPLNEIKNIIDDYHKKWVFDTNGRNITIINFLKRAISNYDLTIENLEQGSFNKEKFKYVNKLVKILIRIRYLENIDAIEKRIYIERIEKVLKAMIDADNAITYSFFLKNSMSVTAIGEDESTSFLNRFVKMDIEACNQYQQLLLYLTEVLLKNQYKRYKGNCCKRVYTPSGHDTHFWKTEMTIKEFIFSSINEDTNFNMWLNLTAGKGNFKEAVSYFENIKNQKFPEIVRDRHVFSFNNGIYFTCKWSDNIDCIDYKEGYIDEFIPYIGENSKNISTDIIACNYFNIDFDITTLPSKTNKEYRYNNWFNIIIDKCQTFKKIMDDQFWEEDVQKWLCIFLGRLLYKVSELDEWQVMPYLLGQGGTGKSTILNRIVKYFFMDIDVGTMSNNMETKFGLSALYNKLCFIGPEIKNNFTMEQSEFQSIISGEDVQINVKNQVAHSVKWDVPGIIAGNEVPNFNDNAGSISRRILAFMFNEKIKKGDTQLGRRLYIEMGHIIHACNRGYIDAVNKYGSSDIWNVLPKYFKDTRDEMSETTNALMNFLNSGVFIFDKNLYIPEKFFIHEFNEYCKEKNFPKARWSKQYTMGPYSNRDLHVETSTRKYPDSDSGSILKAKYIIGLDMDYSKIKDNSLNS